MKTVIESYGTAILASIVIATIITLLMIIPDGKGNVGIFQIIGSGSDYNDDLYKNMKDTSEVLEVYSRTDAPVLTLNTSHHFVANQQYVLGAGFNIKIANNSKAYKLSDYFIDASSVFSFDVVTLTTEDGSDYLGIYNDADGKITFPQAGNYIMTIRCHDKANGKITINTFTVPVDNT